jgi:hypothetical protein
MDLEHRVRVARRHEYTLVLGIAALTVAFTVLGSLSLDTLVGCHLSGTFWGMAGNGDGVREVTTATAEASLPAGRRLTRASAGRRIERLGNEFVETLPSYRDTA